MAVIPLRLKREDKIKKYIDQFLINIGQDCEDKWWSNPQASRALTRLAGATQPQVTDSFDLCIDGKDILVVGAWDGDMRALEQLITDVQSRVENMPRAKDSEDSEKKTIQFLFFTSDLKSRTALEMRLDPAQKKVLKNAAKKSIGLQVACRYTFVIDREYSGEIARIRDINRYDSIPMPPISGSPNTDTKEHPKKNLPCSIVLTVPLRQLIELYNQVGDQLFNRNVRLGIGDKMDVHRAMYHTLEKEPEHFWYMNNGITLLVDDPDFRLNSADSLELGMLEPDSVPRFSVINGAQTISICSEYAFEWEYRKENCPERKNEAKKRLKDFEKAQVILRVIHVPLCMEQNVSFEEQENIRLANNISISLNRQKPVKQEDIAFTTPFVQKMLEYLENKADAPFCLVRRGENRHVTQMDLVEFSKARLACVNLPGKARAVSSGEIMALEFNTDNFRKKDIFVDEWLADDIERDDVFRRYYGAVLFTSQLEACYKRNQKPVQKEMKNENCEENSMSALNNGSWYFTALLVQLLNDFSTDYSKFDCTVSAIQSKVPQAMRIFANMAVYCTEEKETLNSNDFKNEDLYMMMLSKLKEPKRAPLFQEFVELFAAFVKESEKTKSGLIQIVYGPSFNREAPAPVKSASRAFAVTVEDILAQFAPDPNELENFSAWLTKDQQKPFTSHNYTKDPPHVVYNGNTYWIGTSISNINKCVYLDRLCELAGVPKGEITWKKGDTTLYNW